MDSAFYNLCIVVGLFHCHISMHHYDSVALYEVRNLQKDCFWIASLAFISRMSKVISDILEPGGVQLPEESRPELC